ncbi:MAG: hypothetical protein CMF23_15290 [Ignavibacteriae bacterium]|jgi:hypothetical protein|nr:hypothetical protein [Ignavibacteriota bacterium]
MYFYYGNNFIFIGASMRILNIVLFFVLSSFCFAQINIEYLNDVPEEFKEKYFSQKRDYNPLQVGNIWQYYDAEYNVHSTIKVLQDSIINGKKYFKKSIFPEFTTRPDANISWERNDTTSGVSFMLDFEDVNNNGDFFEELPLDSLENPYWSRYKTYKYPFFGGIEKTTLVKDTSWVILEGDTVISRTFEIIDLFWIEEIIEKFGIFWNWSESPARYCTGAIINGRQYGTIVSVYDNSERTPTDFFLKNNYPNPFNPSTTINYQLPEQSFVSIKVYNMLGETISVLKNEFQNSGSYSLEFDGSDLPSGTYLYKIQAGSYYEVKKMLLVK